MNILKSPADYAAQVMTLNCGDRECAIGAFKEGVLNGKLENMPRGWLVEVALILATPIGHKSWREGNSAG